MIMMRKDDNGSMAARFSLAAGVLLILLAGTTEASDKNPYLEYNQFIRDIEETILILKKGVGYGFSIFDVIGFYYHTALLALGSKGETQDQLLDVLNYVSTDEIIPGTALLNQTLRTYSQYSFESYIDLSEKANLDSEFDRIVTQDIPFVVKRHSKTVCKNCSALDISLDPLTFSQQVCISTYSDYKAKWAKQFDPKQTLKTMFNRYPGVGRPINLMSRTGLALYKEDKDLFKMQMLTIPFASLDSVLMLMKPTDGSHLVAFGNKVYSDFDNVMRKVADHQAPTNVKIRLPKYKEISNVDLKKPLENAGLILLRGDLAETAILKEYPNTYMKYYDAETKFEMNEEGINFNAHYVAGNIKCDGIPKRKIPELKKSSVKSPFVKPEFASFVEGIANETLKPALQTVVEFNGTSPFIYYVLTTDFTILAVGGYLYDTM